MKDKIEFLPDTPENTGRLVSSNLVSMEWDDEREWPLRVTFIRGGTYEYDVANINQSPDLWDLLKAGLRWSKEAEKTGEFVRGSHGAAFDYLIKSPIGYNKSLYRKVG